jgi:hypothetical protein
MPSAGSVIGRAQLQARSRLISSGDWFIFVGWVIAGVASVLVASQPGATQGTVMLVVVGVTLMLVAGGWAVDRLGIYSPPPMTRPTGRSYVPIAVLFQAIWWIGYAVLGGGFDGSAQASAANLIWFVAGLQLTDLFARAVDRYRQPVVGGHRGSPQQA